jgi:hypothetical protein
VSEIYVEEMKTSSSLVKEARSLIEAISKKAKNDAIYSFNFGNGSLSPASMRWEKSEFFRFEYQFGEYSFDYSITKTASDSEWMIAVHLFSEEGRIKKETFFNSCFRADEDVVGSVADLINLVHSLAVAQKTKDDFVNEIETVKNGMIASSGLSRNDLASASITRISLVDSSGSPALCVSNNSR